MNEFTLGTQCRVHHHDHASTVTVLTHLFHRNSPPGTVVRASVCVFDTKQYCSQKQAPSQPTQHAQLSQRNPATLLCIISARQHAERAICYRPSVRPSVTREDQSKTVERIIEILSPSDRPNILVFRLQRSLRKSDGFTPNGGAKYKGGSKN